MRLQKIILSKILSGSEALGFCLILSLFYYLCHPLYLFLVLFPSLLVFSLYSFFRFSFTSILCLTSAPITVVPILSLSLSFYLFYLFLSFFFALFNLFLLSQLVSSSAPITVFLNLPLFFLFIPSICSFLSPLCSLIFFTF